MDLLAEYRRATMYFETGDPLGASRLLEPIVEAEPHNASVRQLLARSYFMSAQLKGAEKQLRALIELDPTDHYAHHVLGRTLERGGRPAEALPYLRLALAMHHQPEYEDALRRVEGLVNIQERADRRAAD